MMERVRPLIRQCCIDPTTAQASAIVTILCLVTIGLRLAYATTVNEEAALAGWDGWEYLAYARSICAGTTDGYVSQLDSIRPPLYPAILALCMVVTSSVVPFVQVLQAAAGSVQVVGTYRLARLGVSRRASLVTAAFVALSPHLIFLSAYILTETVFSCFLWTGMYFFVRSRTDTSARSLRWLVAGASLLGLAALTRPTALALGPVLSVLVLIGRSNSFKRFSREDFFRSAIFAGVFVAVVTPWMLRNLSVHGEFTLAPRHGAFILAFGNSSALLKVYESENVEEYYRNQDALTSRFEREGGLPRGEWLVEPRQFVRESTGEWLRLEVHKARHFWTPWVNPMLYSWRVVLVSALYSIPVFLLGIVGLARLWKARSPLVGPLGTVIVVGFLTGGLIFHTQVRYRVPFVDMAFAVAAGAALCRRREIVEGMQRSDASA